MRKKGRTKTSAFNGPSIARRFPYAKSRRFAKGAPNARQSFCCNIFDEQETRNLVKARSTFPRRVPTIGKVAKRMPNGCHTGVAFQKLVGRRNLGIGLSCVAKHFETPEILQRGLAVETQLLGFST